MLKYMNKYKVYTTGCKVAQAEGDQVKTLLDRFGLQEASIGEKPDLCVVNSCAVTTTAAGKSRRLIFKLARLYPECGIILLGCYATLADDSLKDISQLVLIADHHRGIFSAMEHFLLGRLTDQSETTGVGTIQGDNTYNCYIKPGFTPEVKNKFKTISTNHQDRHRAFLKIQDGCNANCTYCIIPHLRSKIQSVPENYVLEQARELLQAGHREIVLTGIFLGAYGKDTTRKNRFETPGQPIVNLIEQLLKLDNLGRIRLSSLEPMDLTDELLKILSSSDKVAGHLHLPLQSGSDTVLQRMGRQYRSAEFLRAVDTARKMLPDLAISSDVIVGFPGETEDDFKKTCEVCEKSEFMKIHTFPFSPRPGTPAWKWRDEILPHEVLENRLARLRQIENRLAKRFRDRFLHRPVRVLVEKVDEKDGICYAEGRADQYFLVRFTAKRSVDNKFCRVIINETNTEPVIGQIHQSE
jgi:threonylcarbamoyladenosine tRNA methylthiotransferase MtaB